MENDSEAASGDEEVSGGDEEASDGDEEASGGDEEASGDDGGEVENGEDDDGAQTSLPLPVLTEDLNNSTIYVRPPRPDV